MIFLFEAIIFRLLVIALAFYILYITNKSYFDGSRPKLKLYKDNGYRVKPLTNPDGSSALDRQVHNKDAKTDDDDDEDGSSGVDMNDSLLFSTRLKLEPENFYNCNVENLIECKISNKNNDCINCDQSFATCNNFERDETIYDKMGNQVGIIKANKTADDGYCLRLLNRDDRECSFKNGGRWILSRTDDDKYMFICLCTVPDFFTNNTMYGDCTEFKGCQNGKISNLNEYTNLSEITCKCNEGYKPTSRNTNTNNNNNINDISNENTTIRDDDFIPTCVPKNIYEREIPENQFNYNLDDKFIDAEYLQNVRSVNPDFKFPNPCTIDAITGMPVEGIGRITQYGDIFYCVATNPRYTTITFNDDYLKNNNGKYANGIVKVSDSDPLPGNIYETHTKRRKPSNKYYNTLVGRRFLYKNFNFTFPWMSFSSANLGGSGKYYPNAQTMKARDSITTAKIYVYDAIEPDDKIDRLILGNTITYVPLFTSKFEVNIKSYLGTIPFIDVELLPCNRMYIVNLLKKFHGTKFSSDGLLGELTKPDQESDDFVRNYSMPILCKSGTTASGKQIQMYSKLFTGIFLTYTHENVLYTKPISPGFLLVDKYRMQADPKWSSYKRSNIVKYIGEPFTIVQSKYSDHLFGENSYGIDFDGISMPHPKFARYITNEKDKTIEWAKTF